jgi:hypothetical protein
VSGPALGDLPDSAPCYVPGFGETTLGNVRRSVAPAPYNEDEETIRMWGYIATHSDAKPWLDPTWKAARR